MARVARPLGLDFHVGLADEEFYRVAHIARSKGTMVMKPRNGYFK